MRRQQGLTAQNRKVCDGIFRIKKDIPFMRHALIFNVVSALTFVAAVFFLLSKGLHFSIEFTGGTVMEVAYPRAANIEISASRSKDWALPIPRCRASARHRT